MIKRIDHAGVATIAPEGVYADAQAAQAVAHVDVPSRGRVRLRAHDLPDQGIPLKGVGHGYGVQTARQALVGWLCDRQAKGLAPRTLLVDNDAARIGRLDLAAIQRQFGDLTILVYDPEESQDPSHAARQAA
jgi:hypothetical protein